MRSIPSTALLLALLAAPSGCAHWDRIDPSRLPGPRDYPDARAIVLLDAVDVRFHSDLSGKAVADITETRRVRILRAGGEHFANIAVFYWPAFFPITDFHARSVAPDGKTQEYSRADAEDLPAFPGFMLYADSRALRLKIPQAAPGSIVEYRYTQRIVEPRMFQFGQAFGGVEPEREVRLDVSHPKGWRIEHLARRLNDPIEWAPDVRDEGDRIHATWVRRDVPPVPVEPLAPDSAMTVPQVQVRLAEWSEHGAPVVALRDAREVSAWSEKRDEGTHEQTPELRALAKEIAGGLTSPGDRARRLYAWVRDHVTYCAIHIGLGAWRPHPAEDVRKLRYGDCKDKANFLHTLLASVDVPSRPSLVYSHGGFPHRFGLPVVAANFNHQILVVDLPDGHTIVDPTSRTAPWGELPVSDQEADLLPLSKDGSPLERTPGSGADVNHQEADYDLALGADGDAVGRYRLSLEGEFADQLRHRFLEAPIDRRNHVMVKWLDTHRTVVGATTVEALEPGEAARPLEVRGPLRIGQAAGGGGASRVLRPSDLLDPWVPVLPDGPRRNPVVLPFRSRRSERLRFALPRAAAVARLPEGFAVDSRFGRYRLDWRQDDRGAIVLERSLVLDEHVVAAADYSDLKRFCDGILAAEDQPALLDLGSH